MKEEQEERTAQEFARYAQEAEVLHRISGSTFR